MSTSDIVCAVCESQNKSTTAAHNCCKFEPEFCSECLNQQKSSSSSNEVSSEDDVKHFVSSESEYCQEHNRKYENYCPQHNRLCCSVCISKHHENCNSILLEDVVKNVNSSAMFDKIVKTLDNLGIYIQNIVADKKQNIAKIKNQRKNIEVEIKIIRDRINKQLDILERQMLKDLISAEDELKSEMETLIEKLDGRASNVEDLRSKMSVLIQSASDLQTFLGSKLVELELDKEEDFIQTVIDDGSLQQVELKCRTNSKLLDTLSSTKVFGSVSVDRNPPSFVIETEKERKSQSLAPVSSTGPKSIDKIRPVLRIKFSIPKGSDGTINITGCTVLPSGKLIFVDCDRNRRLLIIDENGTLDKEITLSSHKPYDVTYLSETLFALSCWCESKILIVSAVTNKIDRIIHTSEPCYGLTQSPGKLICCERKKGIKVVRLEDNASSYVVRRKDILSQTYVAAFGDYIYHTNNEKDTVLCHNTSGQSVWEYKDESVMKGPYGIAVDSNSNVFVASQNNNSIVVISSDGKYGIQLLVEEDGIEYPFAIYCDRQRNNLLVTNYNGKCLVYDVDYI